MRPIIFIFITLVCSANLLGQGSGSDSLVQRLYQEIRNADNVELKYIGCYGNLSTLYKKVDTLKKEIGLNSFINYWNDSSVNLKYYAFHELLALNDNEAFERLLLQANNKDTINLDFPGQHRDRVRLTDLLTSEYLRVMKLKYYYGGKSAWNDKVYSFGKRDRRMWQRTLERVRTFIGTSQLNQSWIESYGL